MKAYTTECNKTFMLRYHNISSIYCFSTSEIVSVPSLSVHSFFLGELEKCLEDPDRLASLFVKQVKTFSFSFACKVIVAG